MWNLIGSEHDNYKPCTMVVLIKRLKLGKSLV
jgi:hypothetical protein